jgi:hypothetical protein
MMTSLTGHQCRWLMWMPSEVVAAAVQRWRTDVSMLRATSTPCVAHMEKPCQHDTAAQARVSAVARPSWRLPVDGNKWLRFKAKFGQATTWLAAYRRLRALAIASKLHSRAAQAPLTRVHNPDGSQRAVMFPPLVQTRSEEQVLPRGVVPHADVQSAIGRLNLMSGSLSRQGEPPQVCGTAPAMPFVTANMPPVLVMTVCNAGRSCNKLFRYSARPSTLTIVHMLLTSAKQQSKIFTSIFLGCCRCIARQSTLTCACAAQLGPAASLQTTAHFFNYENPINRSRRYCNTSEV